MTPAQKRNARDLWYAENISAYAKALIEAIEAAKKAGLYVDAMAGYQCGKMFGNVNVRRDLKRDSVKILEQDLIRK